MKHRALFAIISVTASSACSGAPDLQETGDEAGSGEVSQAIAGACACAIQTINGNYLTAVDGGGRTTNVIHTDATRIGPWERFELVGLLSTTGPIITDNGRYLTAVGGGGRVTDVIHSDAKAQRQWETFQVRSIAGTQGSVSIRTYNGNYLTAVGGGGQLKDAIHSDAIVVGPWETFRLASCTCL